MAAPAEDTKKDKGIEEGAHDEAPKKKKGKLLIIIIAAVVVVAGAGAFFFLKGGLPGGTGGEKAAESAHGAPAADEHGGAKSGVPAAGPTTTVSLEPFIVNLVDNSGTRYLKITVNLEISGSTAELQGQSSKIRDALIILLSSKSYADIGTVEGKYQLRDEIVNRINQFLTSSKVTSAYFTDFVVQ